MLRKSPHISSGKMSKFRTFDNIFRKCPFFDELKMVFLAANPLELKSKLLTTVIEHPSSLSEKPA